MLHRSFKAGKCKTSLKLAVARIKLLKNKRETQLKQMKKELAQLLEAGQERTARIRVEHVVREEKTMAAYDLIEIYCELIAARLPIIESQKNCPIDLKEAIASVVFASPRCSDIPELSDVRKHFTAKYGKEFIASVLELRPECGVGRMMIEKLSAKAPDGETKIKLLTVIAREHNVKWDPEEFSEKELKPPEDLLNGPNAYQGASNVPVVSPTVQLSHGHEAKYESSVNLSERNVPQSAKSSQNFGHTYSSMTTSRPEPRASVNAAEGRASGPSSAKEESSFPSNSQNWSMEFTDATSAAQAAAESAERASVAARAAAELSSIGRVRQKSSAGSQESFVNSYSGDGLKKSTGPMSKSEHIVCSVNKDDLLRTSSGMDPNMQDEQRHRNHTETMAGISDSMFDVHSNIERKPNHSTQLGTTIRFPDEDTWVVDNLQKAGAYSQRSSFNEEAATTSGWHTDKTEKDDFLGEVRVEKQSSEFVVESLDPWQNRQKIEHSNSGKERIRKQSGQSTFISHGSAGAADMMDSKLGTNGSDDARLSSSSAQGNVKIGTKQRSFNNYPDAVFDDSGSDDDCNLVAENVYSHHELNLYGPSEDSKSPSHISEHIKSPRRQGSGYLENSRMQSHFTTEPVPSSEYSESKKEVAVPSRSSEIVATFDDSDGLYSDSDEEANINGRNDLPLNQTALTRSRGSPQINRVHGAVKSTFKKKESTGSYQKPWLHSSSDDSECDSERNLEENLDSGGPAQEKLGHMQSSSLSLAEEVEPMDDFGRKLSSKDLHSPVVEEKRQPLQSSQFSLTKEKVRDDVNAQGLPDNKEDSRISHNLSSESGQGLNFGRLTGGFRNKGHIHPPYNKGPSWDGSSQSREQSDEGTSAIRETANSGVLYWEPYPQKQAEVQPRTNEVYSKTIFDSDTDDDETEVSRHQTVRSSGHSHRGLSRRTRDSAKQPEANSLPRFTSGSEVAASSEWGKPLTQASYDTKSISRPETEKIRYGNRGGSSLGSSTSEEYSKPLTQVRSTENSKVSTTDVSVGQQTIKAQPQNEYPVCGEASELSHPSSVVKQPSLLHSSARSSDTKTSKAPSLSEDSGSRENSLEKASHVHPKLPDYETFAAHFEALRSNRRSG